MIYLDNNAFTLMDPEVKAAMDALDLKLLGNPSSLHRAGQYAKGLLVEASCEIASYFGVQKEQLVFTSGATEALNMVISGYQKKGHIITSNLEHVSVLQALKKKEQEGFSVTYVPGVLTLEKMIKELRENTTLIVTLAVNNETGVKTDIVDLERFALEKGLDLIIDGVAQLGKEIFTVPKGAFCVSSHKIHGPSGVGLAIIPKHFKMAPLIVGGVQQGGKRGGTENVLGIVGFAKAVALLKKKLPEAQYEMERLRNRLEEGIRAFFPQLIIHGISEQRVCNVSHMAFPGYDGEMLLMHLDLAGVAVSMGAACSSGGIEPSHVLINEGVANDIAASSLRFSLSRNTTEEEIDEVIRIMKGILF